MFDIQRFADTVTSEQVLNIKTVFTDDDNRTITVPNARNDISSAEIADLEEWIVATNILLGDKALADVSGVESAVLVATSRIKIDIS